MSNRILREHQRRNGQSRDAWKWFAAHRARVTELLISHASGSLCLLGAGNCNDVDLQQLQQHFDEILLVDVDEQALQAGLAAQGCADHSQFQCRQYDLHGVTEALEHERSDALLQALAATPPPAAESFDVVASIGLLSQLFDSLRLGLGDGHPDFLRCLRALRERHLRQLIEMARPGGHVLLVTDFVSSDTFPALPVLSDAELQRTVPQLIQDHNFFTGTNPALIHQFLTEDAGCAERLRGVRMISPWLWDFGVRTYAVYAVDVAVGYLPAI